MIAFKGGRLSPRGHRTGLGKRFIPLMRYLADGPRGAERPDRVLHFATRHLPADTPLAAGFLMACCAEDRRPDFELPVYHFGASAAVGEELTPKQWEHVANLMLDELGLTDHECAIVVHDDTKCQHVHIVVNRISVDGEAFKPWMDYPLMRRAMRRAERDLGLQVVAEPVGHHDDRSAQPVEHTAQPASPAVQPEATAAQWGSTAAQPQATPAQPGATEAKPGSTPAQPEATGVQPGATAAQPVDELARFDRQAKRPQQPRLNDIDFCSARGSGVQPLADAVRERALGDFLAADSWDDLEQRLSRHGLRLEPARRGGGVVVWTDLDEPVSISKIDRRLSGPKLAKRFDEPFTVYRERVPEPPEPDGFLPVRRVELGERQDRVKAILDLIEAERATFTEQEVRRHVRWQHDQDGIVEAVLADPRVERIGLDDEQRPIFTTTAYRRAEVELLDIAGRLHDQRHFQLDADAVRERLDRDFTFLADEQRDAVLASTTRGDLALIAGRAGSGKTALTQAIVDAYRDAGIRVQGAALTGKAAEGLGAETGIDSRTLAALRTAWAKGRDQLDEQTVLLVDEAGMLGTRELAELLATVERAGAKAILVGDPDQLRAIEAGDAFAGLLETFHGSRIETIRRQHVDWMRAASVDLADGRVADALHAYADHGAVGWANDLGDAKWQLVTSYFDNLDQTPEATRLVLARRNVDVDELNDLIRARRRQRGELGRAIRLKGRELAEGDRVVFTRNDHDGRHVRNVHVDDETSVDVPADDDHPSDDAIGVKNGTLGRLVHATRDEIRVELDTGRLVAFDPRAFQDLRVGYAVTLYKAQGATVDRTFALLDPHFDRHGAYVAATRHRDHLGLWLDRQSFADLDAAARTLGRRGPNDLWIAAEGRAGDGDEDRAADALRVAVEKQAAIPINKLLGDPDNAHERTLFENLPEAVLLPDDHITTREYRDAERQLGEVAGRLAGRVSFRLGIDEHLPPETDPDPVVRAVDGPDLTVFEGGRDAILDHFRAITDQYRGTDRELVAVAFTARHAEALGRDLGIESHTFAGLKYRGHRLGQKTVLLVDQANLADVRTLGPLLRLAEEAGSRVVLGGDPSGFDPIGAGDAFRLVREDLGAVPLLPELETPDLDAYTRLRELDAAGHVQLVDDAQRHIVERYVSRYEDVRADERPCILTHQRASADALNRKIRDRRADELGRSVEIDGRPFAEGDRVLFTASDAKGDAVRTVDGPEREQRPGVRSGLLGTLEKVEGDDLVVRLDDGRLVAFDPTEFNAIDYGYALTTFRANGSRADDVIVYAQGSMDRAAALVALSTHRRSLTLVGSADVFESVDDIAETFARQRGKLLVRDLIDERAHAARPEHRPGDGRPLQVVRGVESTGETVAESGVEQVNETAADDPVEATLVAIGRLRDYDAAVQRLDDIDSRRRQLAHGGDVVSLREALTEASGDAEQALIDDLVAVYRLDQEAKHVRAQLDGGRDARVADVFGASRDLGPEGFERLDVADRALVRELWSITVEPIEEAAHQLERARDEALAESPDEAPNEAPNEVTVERSVDDRFEKLFVALGTRAALATAPRPVRRAAATAFAVADLVRDTPRALLRTLTPKPLQHILTAVRVVAHLVGDPPPQRLVEPFQSTPTSSEQPWRPFTLDDIKPPGADRVFVTGRGNTARVLVDDVRLGISEPMSRPQAVALAERLLAEGRRTGQEPDWQAAGIRSNVHPKYLHVVNVDGAYAMRFGFKNYPTVFKKHFPSQAKADYALDRLRRALAEGQRPNWRQWTSADPAIQRLAQAVRGRGDVDAALDEARRATARDLFRGEQELTPEEHAAVVEDLAAYGEVRVREQIVKQLSDQIYETEVFRRSGYNTAVELRQKRDEQRRHLKRLPSLDELKGRLFDGLADRRFDAKRLVAKVPYKDTRKEAKAFLDSVQKLRNHGVARVIALNRLSRHIRQPLPRELLGDIIEKQFDSIRRLTPPRFGGAIKLLGLVAEEARQQELARARSRWRSRSRSSWEL